MCMGNKQWKFGLMGFPLEHSLSPRLHQAALAALGWTGSYDLFAIPPDRFENSLVDLLDAMRIGKIHGLNVTLPYKRRILPHLEQIAEEAQGAGAVNTIVFNHGQLVGYNTDVPGFMADLMRLGWLQELTLKQSCALVLGAGGAGRAVIFSLLRAGFWIKLVARRSEQAREVKSDFMTLNTALGEKIEVYGWTSSEFRRALKDVGVVVNCTPLGMWPHVESSPWPDEVPLPEEVRLYDLVYRPPHTAFLRLAERHGNPRANGLGMLIEQAALSFELWTGVKAPRESMRQAIREISH